MATNLPFGDVVKAQLTQAALTALLERGGYRVVRLGIEELLVEVKSQGLAQYRSLALPQRLRCLPDLLVASPDGRPALLVEVKFRRRFDDRSALALYRQLQRQRRHWPEAYAVLMISEPFRAEARFHQDYIRVLPPRATNRLIEQGLDPQRRWEGLPQLQKVFHKFKASARGQILADSVAVTLGGMAMR
jgi:hypothetical protein